MSRTDFEAAYIERYGHRPRGWNDDFQVYQDAHANGAWFGWQARAAGIEAKAAPVGERDERGAFEAWFFCPSNSLLAEWEDAAWEAYQAGAAPSAPKAYDPVKQMLLEALEDVVAWAYRNTKWDCIPIALLRAQCAISAVREEVMK